MSDNYKYGKSAAGKAMARSLVGGAGALGMGAGIYKGIEDAKDYCLNPGKTTENVGMNFLKNFLNIAGGLGDVIFGAAGYKTPEESLKEQVGYLNQQYRSSFDSFTMSFASQQSSFDENIVSTMEDMNLTNNAIELYYKDMLQEEIDLNTIRILFLFIFIIIIYLFILIR